MTAPHTLVVDAILFDMDGTLVDSNSVVESMWAGFAEHHGLDVAQVLEFSHGTPSTATLRRFLPPSEDFDTWFARVAAWESEHFGDVVAMKGAAELVAGLPPRRWAVVTSALADAARLRLATVGLPVPPVLVGADDVSRGKPHPDGFVLAAERLGVDPSACLVLEDSPAGIDAGLAAGCHVVAIGTTPKARERGLTAISDLNSLTARVQEDGRIALTVSASIS